MPRLLITSSTRDTVELSPLDSAAVDALIPKDFCLPRQTARGLQRTTRDIILDALNRFATLQRHLAKGEKPSLNMLQTYQALLHDTLLALFMIHRIERFEMTGPFGTIVVKQPYTAPRELWAQAQAYLNTQGATVNVDTPRLNKTAYYGIPIGMEPMPQAYYAVILTQADDGLIYVLNAAKDKEGQAVLPKAPSKKDLARQCFHVIFNNRVMNVTTLASIESRLQLLGMIDATHPNSTDSTQVLVNVYASVVASKENLATNILNGSILLEDFCMRLSSTSPDAAACASASANQYSLPPTHQLPILIQTIINLIQQEISSLLTPTLSQQLKTLFERTAAWYTHIKPGLQAQYLKLPALDIAAISALLAGPESAAASSSAGLSPAASALDLLSEPGKAVVARRATSPQTPPEAPSPRTPPRAQKLLVLAPDNQKDPGEAAVLMLYEVAGKPGTCSSEATPTGTPANTPSQSPSRPSARHRPPSSLLAGVVNGIAALVSKKDDESEDNPVMNGHATLWETFNAMDEDAFLGSCSLPPPGGKPSPSKR